MRTKVVDRTAIFQSVRGTAEITGLSTKYIREGCRAGRIPHIRVGSDYKIDLPRYLEELRSPDGEAL